MPNAPNIEEIKSVIEGEEYVLLDTFIKNGKRMVEVICPNKHITIKRYDGFKRGEKCKECKKLSYVFVKSKIEEDNCKLVSKEYINSKTKLLIEFKCGHIGFISYNSFSFGRRCGKCSNNNTHSYNYIKDFIENVNEYKLLSKEYVRGSDKLLIKCGKGHEYSATFGSFRQGHRCPSCKESKGEKLIKEILEQNNILYNRQHTFNDCRYKSMLFFDFYIPNLNLCIEYDGKQHFEPIPFNGSIEKAILEFNQLLKRDEIKNKYCEKNKIRLIRIPYWQYEDIEEILKEELF